MASTKKFFTTPLGTVQPYAYIQSPDTQFNDRGEYRIKLAIPTSKAQGLIKLIEDTHQENMANLKANPKFQGKRIKEGDLPFFEDGEGNVIFTFKMYGSYKTPQGEHKVLNLGVYDSRGQRIQDVPNISGGSTGKVAFSLFAYAPSGAVGASVKLQLSKFQLKDLVEYKAGGNDTFGDTDDEEMLGGYVAQAKPKDAFTETTDYDTVDNSYNDDEDF